MSELALRLIEENKKTRAPFLVLGNCGLTEVPAEIGELVWLEELSFSCLEKIQGFERKINKYGPENKIRYLKVKTTSNPFQHLVNLKRLWFNCNLNKTSYSPTNLSALASLKNLEILDFSSTRISNLSGLSNLSKLKYLDVSYTQVSDITPIAQLKELEILDVSCTEITELTPISSLTNLKELSFHQTQVCDLLPLTKLPYLRRLEFFMTKVLDINHLSELTDLEFINIWSTKITDLSPIAKLHKLQYLQATRTQVKDLSPLTGLRKLIFVEVSGTLVSDIYPLLPLIQKGILVKEKRGNNDTKGIFVEKCPLYNPPLEVVKQGNEAILNYFKEKEIQGVDYLYEAKLLIVGEGGSGKTSLLRRLYQTEKPLPEEADTTKGIDIYRHEFKTKEGRDFRLNVWDFGGQEIYHATHQFFLTKRSLYVLLDDTRKDHKTVQDKEFKYWLEVVDQLSDHSPVLIFQNEKGGRSKTIDEAGIKGHFGNVKEVFRGNLEVINSAEKLREALEYYARNLPHIGEELPKLWVAIRAELETLAEQKPYITQQEYFDLYSQHLPFDRTKALHLSRYFHDLGVFLHFQDDWLLAKTVILQNTWATEAVFKMLDDETVKLALGRFTLQDCQRVWQDSVYADMHPELLALMQKFELCYRLPDAIPETWLATQLLPPSKPVQLDKWEQPGDLVLRYRYDFMPKGLISRLMVRLHRFVPQPDLGWVTGVLFERDGSQVLVEIPPKGGEIALRARGSERKELLSVIAADLDALNDSFHGLKERVEKLVPCNCTQCRKQSNPESFEQKRLLQRKRDGKLKVECPTSYEDVDVLELLDGISVKTLPGWAKEEDHKITQSKIQTQKSAQRTIKIFLASSSELLKDRDDFELYFLRQNNHQKNFKLEIIRWENFLDAMSGTRLQDEYNKAVCNCDIFVSLFFTKTGKYTEEEFNVAHQQFIQTKKPLIYTFFKNAPVNMGNVGNEVLSLLNFKNKLGELGHFYTGYDNIEHLKRQFKDQLEKLLEDGL